MEIEGISWMEEVCGIVVEFHNALWKEEEAITSIVVIVAATRIDIGQKYSFLIVTDSPADLVRKAKESWTAAVALIA